MFKLVLEKSQAPEIKSTGSLKKQESSNKTSISALLTISKPLTVWITTNYGKFLKRQIRCSGIPISWRIFHSLLWSTQSKVFLELSCFFHDPANVGNLISGSSAFSKTSLNIRKFTVHILLKPAYLCIYFKCSGRRQEIRQRLCNNIRSTH